MKAVILGIIEGITEFLRFPPLVHMLLAQRFFGLGDGAFWQSFVILIQLGAILAIVALYFDNYGGSRWACSSNLRPPVRDRRAGGVPAGGGHRLIAGKYIKELLFNPWVVCFTLIAGGAILLWVDQLDLKPHEETTPRAIR